VGRRTAAEAARAGAEERERDDVAFEEETPISDSALELLDVPAAVVCATCGQPDCAGCAVEEPTHASGIVAIVPWERPGVSAPRRLWSTARLTTLSAESFFAALPDGDVGAALRFALVSELFAVVGLCIVAIPVTLAFAPWFFELVSKDPFVRQLAFRAFAFGVPALALAMVGFHAAHGLGLDVGARRLGGRPKGSRGLRFGLYSCGWDLVTLPAGLAVLSVTDGFGAARKAAPLSLTVPGRASRAFLRGVHRLDEATARRAARLGTAIAGALVLGAVLFAVAVFVLASLV
jgi:hypothetical protein